MYAPYKLDEFNEIKPLEKWRQDLLAAAALIREFGLAKRHREDGAGRMCVYGALDRATNYSRDADVSDAAHRFGLYLRETGVATTIDCWDDECGLLIDVYGQLQPHAWNNAPERTADEVIAALEAAALS